MRPEKNSRRPSHLAFPEMSMSPIAGTSSQEALTSRILTLQNELQSLQKQLSQPKGLTNPVNPLSRRASLTSLDLMSQSEDQAPLSIFSPPSQTHPKPRSQMYSHSGASHTYSRSHSASQDHFISPSTSNNSAIIMKPSGSQPKKICEVLNLSASAYKAYRGNLRDLIKARLDPNITWKEQDMKQVLRLIDKFKATNPHFPKTSNDWAIKDMARKIINNKREYRSKKRRGKLIKRSRQRMLNKASDKDFMDERQETELNKENESEISKQSEYPQQKTVSNKVSVEDFMSDSDISYEDGESIAEYLETSRYMIANDRLETSGYFKKMKANDRIEEERYNLYQESEISESEASTGLYESIQTAKRPMKQPLEQFEQPKKELAKQLPEQSLKRSVKEPAKKSMKRPSEQSEQSEQSEKELAKQLPEHSLKKSVKKPAKKSMKQPSEQLEHEQSEIELVKQPAKPPMKQPLEQPEQLAKKPKKPAKQPQKQYIKLIPEQRSSEDRKGGRSAKCKQQLKNFNEPDGSFSKRKSARLSAKAN